MDGMGWDGIKKYSLLLFECFVLRQMESDDVLPDDTVTLGD